jgi:hypothetical protein
MLVDASNSTAGSVVTGAISQASQATGTSFNYLLATAQVESGLDPRAGASTSSARGLFQFVEQTWLGTMRSAGQALGYGRYADAISKNAAGHYEVKDPAMRREILSLRNDPTANAVMAGAFTKTNASILSAKLGRAPSEGELYIAHFLGAGGAARLISLAAATPNAKATHFFSHAAQANRSIFFDRTTGAARSLAQVRDILTARYDIARAKPDDSMQMAQATTELPDPVDLAPALPAVAPSTAIPTDPLDLTPAQSAQSVQTAAAPAVAPAVAALGDPLDLTPGRAGPASAAMPVPDTAGITSAFAAASATPPTANDRPVFRGLYQDPDRPAPLAAMVSELWGVPSATAGASAASTSTPESASLLDLFKDPEERS